MSLSEGPRIALRRELAKLVYAADRGGRAAIADAELLEKYILGEAKGESGDSVGELVDKFADGDVYQHVRHPGEVYIRTDGKWLRSDLPNVSWDDVEVYKRLRGGCLQRLVAPTS